MKKTFFISICFFIFTLCKADIYSDVNSAMQSGNYKVIAGYFGSSVELNLPNNEGIYSKAQAESILKEFFAEHTPKSYEVKHEGKSKETPKETTSLASEGGKYSIGELKTSKGTYRTYLFYKTSGNSVTIKELRIEQDE